MSTPTPAAFVRTAPTWLSYSLLGYYGYLVATLGPALPFLRAELTLSYTIASLHFTALALGVTAAGLVGDRLTRRRGRHTALSAGVVGMSAGVLVLTLTAHVGLTITGALIMGAFGGLLLSGAAAILTDAHPRHVAATLTEANVVSSALAILAPLLIGAAAAVLTWRVGLLIALAGAAVLSLALRRITVPAPATVTGSNTATSPATSSQPRLPGRYWAWWCMLVLVDAVEFSMTFWAATYLEDHTGLTRATAAAGVSLFLIGMLAGRLTGTRLSLRGVHTPTLLRAALVLALLGFLVYRLTTSTALVLTGLFLTGLGVATLWPLALAQAVQAAPGNSDAAAARASFAAGTAISLAPLSLGALADWFGIATAYWIVALLLITALVMHTRLQAPPPHSLGGDPWAKRNGQR